VTDIAQGLPATPPESIGAEIVAAAHTLVRHGLVTAFGHVSARVPGGILITPAAALADVSEPDLIFLGLTPGTLPATLPPGTPAEAWAHLMTYATRQDVTAIARAQPPSAFAAASVLTELPILHGQAAWLGTGVPVHPDARLLRDAELAEAAVRTLADADALLLRGNGALTCGLTPGAAAARMWLLATACSVWLSAAAAGTPRPLDAAELAYWRGVQRELLPRLWLQLRLGV
jgi:ribulose-5-phosphate 4-epimerase/fuculose-1-phosphate aldolase